MNSNKRLYLIGFLVVALFAILYLSIMERIEIPDVDLTAKYESQDKDPYGLYLFEELVPSAFPQADFQIADELKISDYINEEEVLYIWIADRIGFDDEEWRQVDSFLQEGNELLLIANRFNGSLDSLLTQNNVMTYSYSDTSIVVNWGSEADSIQTDTLLTFLDEDLISPKRGNYSVLSTSWNYDSTYTYEPEWLVSYWDEEWIYGKLQGFDSLYVHVHASPIVFTNIALKEKKGLQYLNRVLSQFDAQTIVIDSHVDKRKIWSNPDDTPLTFIMSQPPLRWTYYLILAGILLFVIYQSGRKQRIIPVIPSYKNTSMDHVEMIAELYESHRKHGQLIKHMESWFYHTVERKYFINPKDINFSKKLSIKSRVPKEEIEIIINRFSRIKNSRDISAYDLRVFYKSLERFYERCK